MNKVKITRQPVCETVSAVRMMAGIVISPASRIRNHLTHADVATSSF